MKRPFALLFATVLSAALAAPAWAQIQDPIKVEQGKLSGAPGRKPGVKVYRGIPYAAPPVGELRWKAPQPPAHWQGVRQATEFSHDCMQITPNFPDYLKPLHATSASKSEDCLYLDVWTPANSASDKLPVMVWIHGGGFTIGSASFAGYDGENLAHKGVVVVGINYRLGIFGFFALPELTAESPHHASGNYGLMDQIAALKWVKRNIAAFGGDPANVTIFGESAGSWAVNLLTASPLAKGLFEHGIGESGASFVGSGFRPMTSRADAEKAGEKLASEMGISGNFLRALRAKPADELMKAAAGKYRTAGAIVDGWVLPQNVATIYAEGKQNDVPVIVGNNANEMTALMQPISGAAQFIATAKQRYGAMADQFLKAYPADSDAEAIESAYDSARDESFGWNMREWARMQTKTGHHPAYRYYFSHRPPGPEGQKRGAFHTSELAYVFGNFAFPFPWEDADRQLSAAMMSYWTNFAKTGNPNGPGLPNWPAYNPTEDNVLDFDVPITVRTHVNQAGLDFFDAYHASLSAARPSGGSE